MARAFAQHADAGKYHLEIRYADGQQKPWEWFVLDAKRTTHTIHSGQSETLAGAQKSAAAYISLGVEAQWTDIEPPL